MAATTGIGSEKANARKRAWRKRQHEKRFGPNAGDQRGRHGKHARGDKHPKFKGYRFVTSQGYIAVRVPVDHPHAWGANPNIKYAYEHILIAEEKIGRPLADNEVVHHRHENKQDNVPSELEVLTASEHAAEHCRRRGRDSLGRFPKKY